MHICTRCLRDGRLEKVCPLKRESRVQEGGDRPRHLKCVVPSIQLSLYRQSFTTVNRSDQELLASWKNHLRNPMFEAGHVRICFALENKEHKGNMLHYLPQLYGLLGIA